ncbi:MULTISPECIES: hypothetical protein [Gordonia]|jgi:hypothetical protein|uniref:Transmembrane protein n=1 Tax=Gordonia pseudamarae TaxID=2831662 RepID=A0ABX6ILH2_9ACTN|nr:MULTISPECIES: hypothetical protein [Gordonia]MBD0020630.1 hypothetical protein [Gordonia sp. (in: high G+C Gram-positive bacteria)]QHN36557.1 hypothetical protein GII31_18335 [Gordonia pseudamarae]
MHTVESIAKVLVVGLILGAGLPALFAVGLKLHADGAGDEHADGTVTAPNPALKAAGYLLFGLVVAVIIVGILWVCRHTLDYHLGIRVFPESVY